MFIKFEEKELDGKKGRIVFNIIRIYYEIFHLQQNEETGSALHDDTTVILQGFCRIRGEGDFLNLKNLKE